MNPETRAKLISKIFGGSLFLAYIVRREFRLGHKIKAALVGLYTYPLRKLLTIEKAFITAPREYYEELHDLLHLSEAEGFQLLIVGRDNDGGYIMLDDFDGGIAYSFGVNDDVSWDKDMASRGYDVFMYDHMINALPEENPRFHWSKLGLAGGSTHDDRLKTLEELIALNHHEDERNMIPLFCANSTRLTSCCTFMLRRTHIVCRLATKPSATRLKLCMSDAANIRSMMSMILFCLCL